MKSMLDETNYEYTIIDVTKDKGALTYIKDNGHKTVPQVYLNDIHINKKTNTQEYTSAKLYDIIVDVLGQQDWPWQDSGIEQGM
jgi:glutaredoxin